MKGVGGGCAEDKEDEKGGRPCGNFLDMISIEPTVGIILCCTFIDKSMNPPTPPPAPAFTWLRGVRCRKARVGRREGGKVNHCC